MLILGRHDKIKFGNNGKLFFSNIGRGVRSILDVSAGEAAWAMCGFLLSSIEVPLTMHSDVARQYPQAIIVANLVHDLSVEKLPFNCIPKRENPDNDTLWSLSYDFVHLREPPKPIKRDFIRKAHAALVEGGWIEISFAGPPQNKSRPWMDWREHLGEALESHRPSACYGDAGDIPILQNWLEEYGFNNIVKYEKKLLASKTCDVDGLVMYPLANLLGWDFTRAAVFAMQMRQYEQLM